MILRPSRDDDGDEDDQEQRDGPIRGVVLVGDTHPGVQDAGLVPVEVGAAGEGLEQAGAGLEAGAGGRQEQQRGEPLERRVEARSRRWPARCSAI